MPHVFTLVLTSPPGARALNGVIGARPLDTLIPAGIDVRSTAWLAAGEAWLAEMGIDSLHTALTLRNTIAAQLSAAPVDVGLLPGEAHECRKRLLVADMESTIIEQEMIDELAEFAGRREEIERITASAMRGELEFEAALKERVAMLAGLDARVLDEVYEKRLTLMPGARALVRTMKANGAYCALVSGGFTVFTERVAGQIGFDEHQANVLEIAGGKLTGRVREPILGRAAKREALERIALRLGVDLANSVAVGDGANDLDMLATSGLGVAFRAKPKVQEAARALPTATVVNYGDLTALLFLQRYRRDEFVADD